MLAKDTDGILLASHDFETDTDSAMAAIDRRLGKGFTAGLEGRTNFDSRRETFVRVGYRF
ncbi:MAG: hypothetical protein KJ601_08040 [Nanoarchaeota archaeon]|nr:hypothetical protein [Nanoarchaeota archaeon]MBU1704453.1 hypothetical protein [Nanoarchaeota archaeon]